MIALAAATVIVWAMVCWLGLGVWRRRGIVSKLKRLIAALFCMSLGILLGALLFILHAFQAFSGHTLVATVVKRPVATDEFELSYTPAQGLTIPTTVHLRGDQWAISGGVVKWRPWLTMIGLKSYHRPLRLSGQFANLNRQRNELSSIYPLVNSGMDSVWEGLYRIGPYVPFIDAVYGSSAYVYVEPNVVQEIYVTPSGYLIKRR